MPEYHDERGSMAIASREIENISIISSQLASPLGAMAFAADVIPDPSWTLGQILCQVSNLKSDAELGEAVREVLNAEVRKHAQWQAEQTGPLDSDYEWADEHLGVAA